jgi:release factor glutamine methyltransferase
MPEIWTTKKALNWTLAYFKKHQVPEARLSAELLLAKVLNLKRLDLYLQFDRILTPGELKAYRQYIQRRICHEPVQYIIGEQEFMGLKFIVTPDVLIPRPETELLVEQAIDEMKLFPEKKFKVLDVGTGSGIIGISVAHFCSNTTVTAVDISREALEIARENAHQIAVNNITFINKDIFQVDKQQVKRFDVILTNPPYVGESEKYELHDQVSKYEPPQALYAGKEGMDFIYRFIPLCPDLLSRNGMLILEFGYNQKDKTLALLEKNQFKKIEFIQDYSKIPRIVKAQI